MARETRDGAVKRADYQTEQAHITRMVLQAEMSGDLHRVFMGSHEGTRITACVAYLKHASGGYVALVSRVDKQSASVACYYAERWLHEMATRHVPYMKSAEQAFWTKVLDRVREAQREANAEWQTKEVNG